MEEEVCRKELEGGVCEEEKGQVDYCCKFLTLMMLFCPLNRSL